ncbi:MAG: glycosyltransferase family 1 protein [Desulfobacteraceae bacterium]|nr:MAG: glycosyltransferase family 1 protein [Desulfobacteraceae bacterium]
MKIKVIHIITRLDKGGSAENTLLTVGGLDKKRYDILLIKGLSIESGMAEDEAAAVEKNIKDAEREGVRILTVHGLVRRIAPFHDIKTLFTLIKILLYERPHIVHTHTSKAGILGRWAAYCCRVPIIIHTPHGHVFWGYFGRLKASFYIILEKVTAFITDKIIALTEQEKNDHLRFRIAPGDKFSVVHSGIRLDKFLNLSVDPAVIKRKLGIFEGDPVVGTTGRLATVKGHRYLIEAAVKIVAAKPNTTFVFLGGGELSDELKNLASKLGVKEKVKFLGWRQDVAEVMSVFDLFVLPSLNEGMGRVLVEAMALGKPIVASDVGGIPDLVVHCINGYLVPPKDVRGLSAAIGHLIEDPEKGRKMGENGKKRAIEYSAEEMIQKIDRLYLTMLQQKQITEGIIGQ